MFSLSTELLQDSKHGLLTYTLLHHNECVTQTKHFAGNQISSDMDLVQVIIKQTVSEKRTLLLLPPHFKTTLPTSCYSKKWYAVENCQHLAKTGEVKALPRNESALPPGCLGKQGFLGYFLLNTSKHFSRNGSTS